METKHKQAPLLIPFVMLAGMVATVALAGIWHACGAVPPPRTASYPFSDFFYDCRGWFFNAAFFAAAAALGLRLRPLWAVAAGMILPLPLAMMIEMADDGTSHNLFPFEVLLNWLPAFCLALAGAKLGQVLARRAEGR